jgi:hypothetical protein
MRKGAPDKCVRESAQGGARAMSRTATLVIIAKSVGESEIFHTNALM